LLEVPAEAHDALPGLLPNAPDGTDVVVVDLPILDGHSGKPAKDDGPAADDIPTEMASDGAEGTLMPPALPPQQPAAPLPLAVAGNREIAEPDDSAAPVGSGAVPVQTQQRLLVLAPDDLATPAPERQETGDQGSSERAPSSPSASALASNTGAPAEAGVRVDGPGDGLSSPLLTQTLPQVAARPTGSPYPVAAQAAVHQPIVQAKAGTMGADVGVEIAKVAKGGRDDLLIRLDPREMGRIDVRLSFDRDGVVRAVLSAESPAALDLLRRESGDLGRALTDAGIRADAQSLRFDTRAGGGSTGGDGWQRGQQAQQEAARAGGLPDDGAQDFTDPVYRPLRASGHVDLMA
jgi:flagellar hook-length control protein FliK